MAANTFGQILRMTSFGESHGVALGCIVDGCPSQVGFSMDILNHELKRRRPGVHTNNRDNGDQFISAPDTSAVVSQRSESDTPEVLSGVFNGQTLGTPIAMIVRNQDARSQDYNDILKSPRAGHADDVWKSKFGISDHRGGGRSSGRETLTRVMAGSIAYMMLQKLCPDLQLHAYIEEMGAMKLTPAEEEKFLELTQISPKSSPAETSAGKFLSSSNSQTIYHPIDQFFARFPKEDFIFVERELKKAQEEGESFGAKVNVVIKNVPANLGQPIFHKLKSDLAAAMLSLGAVSGFELGDISETKLGTQFHSEKSQKQYGGIRGGISTGDNIYFSVKIKPTSSILDVAKKGRHDPCIAIRAIPVIESMVAFVLADHLMWMRLDRI